MDKWKANEDLRRKMSKRTCLCIAQEGYGYHGSVFICCNKFKKILKIISKPGNGIIGNCMNLSNIDRHSTRTCRWELASRSAVLWKKCCTVWNSSLWTSLVNKFSTSITP